MKINTQERLLACGMTAVLLSMLGLIATWVELRSQPRKLKQLSLTESFASVTRLPSSAPPSVTKPATPALRRRTPRILESIQSERSVSAPTQRVLPTTLQLQQKEIPLESAHRNIDGTSVAVTARISHISSALIPSQHAGIQQSLRQAPRAAAKVTGRSDPPGMSLGIERPSHANRVLKTEEAKKIIQWIRVTESDLPPGIKHHVGYQPGNLSATALLEYEGEPWEIYLMARMPSEELHVVIVRGNATYYVVDPSFKRDGRRFRVGVARRSGGQITGITSEERAASSSEATAHYDVFLAWWDKLRLTLQ